MEIEIWEENEWLKIIKVSKKRLECVYVLFMFVNCYVLEFWFVIVYYYGL